MENRLITSIFFVLSLTLSFFGAYFGFLLGQTYPEHTLPFTIIGILLIIKLCTFTYRINRKRYQQIMDHNNQRIDQHFIQLRNDK